MIHGFDDFDEDGIMLDEEMEKEWPPVGSSPRPVDDYTEDQLQTLWLENCVEEPVNIWNCDEEPANIWETREQFEARSAPRRRANREKEKQKMGNLQKYGSFDLDTLDKQDALVEANSSVGADFMKLSPGKNKVRFLPSSAPGESPFIIVNEHFINTPGGQRVRFACPRLMEKKSCPACQQADELKRTGNPLDRDKAWDFYPKLRVYANVYDRENPGNPRILAFGKTIWEGLKRIRRDRDEGGDFTNPMKDGFDVVITREGTGLQTKYAVASSRSDSPLEGDATEVDRIIQAQWDLSKYSSVLTLDEVVDMMENGYQKKSDDVGGRRKMTQIAAPLKNTPRSSARAADQVFDVDSDEIPY